MKLSLPSRRSLSWLAVITILLGGWLVLAMHDQGSFLGQFLPNTYDPSRPQDTWFRAHEQFTAHPLRWPLTMAGLAMVVLGSIGHLWCQLQRLRAFSPRASSTTSHHQLPAAIQNLPLISGLIGGVALGVIGFVQLFYRTSVPPQAVVMVYQASLFVLVAVIAGIGLGSAPYCVALIRQRWQQGALTTPQWPQQRRILATCLVATCLFFCLAALGWLYYCCSNFTTHGYIGLAKFGYYLSHGDYSVLQRLLAHLYYFSVAMAVFCLASWLMTVHHLAIAAPAKLAKRSTTDK